MYNVARDFGVCVMMFQTVLFVIAKMTSCLLYRRDCHSVAAVSGRSSTGTEKSALAFLILYTFWYIPTLYDT